MRAKIAVKLDCQCRQSCGIIGDMKKRFCWWLLGVVTVLALSVVAAGRWLWTLPFVPASWRSRLMLNANIVPASDDSRSQYVAINPGFRVEFGDKDNPTSAWLRFERSKGKSQSNAEVSANQLDSFAITQLWQDYQPGIEWQLFNVGIDEDQLRGGTVLGSDQEMAKIARELLGESVVGEIDTDLQTVASEREQIETATIVERFQGYDQVSNLAVAPDVDLKYVIVPGKGVKSQIWLGDRQGFDTACLQMLSLTGSEAGCNLPSNKFSFLLQLDSSHRLEHVPLALDTSTNGTYYVTDDQGHYLLRLGNPVMRDRDGRVSDAVTMTIRPGQVDGEVAANFYIVTITANLGWLVDSATHFPVTIDTGFYIDGQEFFGEQMIGEPPEVAPLLLEESADNRNDTASAASALER